MGRQTLRDWVCRYNADRLTGLCDSQEERGPEASGRQRRRRNWPNWSAVALMCRCMGWCTGARFRVSQWDARSQ
jgi:hypothetical protein